MILYSTYGRVALCLTPGLVGNAVEISPIKEIIKLIYFEEGEVFVAASRKSKIISKYWLNLSRQFVSSADIKITVYWSIIVSLSSIKYSKVSVSSAFP